MPQIQVSVYLDDADYSKYQQDKVGYNDIARKAMMKAINKIGGK
jgi:hypothetical protein